MIDIEFHGPNPRDRAVTTAWSTYLDHLSRKDLSHDVWAAQRDDHFIELLSKMALALGYDFDKVRIRNNIYRPLGLGEAEDDQYFTRKAMVALLQGKASLPVHAVDRPSGSQLPTVEAEKAADFPLK